jgi:very-short-patch-repair endonuclease
MNMTPSEAKLWTCLRAPLGGFKFRRQHPIRGFIVDFYCDEVGLIVEVDGAVHDKQAEEDRVRAELLSRTV